MVNGILDYVRERPVITEEDRVGDARPLLARVDYAIDLMDAYANGENRPVVFDNNGKLERISNPDRDHLDKTSHSLGVYISELTRRGFLKCDQLIDSLKALLVPVSEESARRVSNGS